MKLAYVISFVAIGMLFNVFGMKLDRKWLSNLGCLVMIAACVIMIADIGEYGIASEQAVSRT